MNLNQLNEQRNKLIADATALLAGENVTAEQRSQFDQMMKDVEVIDADVARVQTAEEYRASLRNPVSQPRPNPGESADPVERAEVRAAQQRDSFKKYVQTGVIESRDLTISSLGGVTVPVGFDPVVREAQKSYGEIYDLVNIMKTDNGEPIKLVLDDDTSSLISDVTVGTNVSEQDPTITGLTLQVGAESTGTIRIDNGLLMDAGFDLEAFIRDKFAKRFFRGASNFIINGNTAGTVQSLTSQYTAGWNSATTAEIGYIDFATAFATLDPAYHATAVWAMNASTLAAVIGLQDSNHRPLFLPNFGDASAGYAGSILGKPVKLVTQLPSIASTAKPILFGDFKAGYTFRQVNPGLSILRLNELYAAGYETGFVGFCRIGGLATKPSSSVPSIVALTIS